MARQLKDFGRQNQAVGGHHHHIGRDFRERVDGRAGFLRILALAAQRAWLQHRAQAGLDGKLFDRAGLQLHAPAGGPVWLGQHGDHRKSGGVNGLKGDAREFRCSRKSDAQWLGLGHDDIPQ